jgi:UDP:flavonoid glycosyltransferase YjiC (YdhE family)
MRVLFTCQADASHFHPLVPIARAMAEAGHEVTFATPAPFVPTVERCGFQVFPAGMAQGVTDAFPEILGLRGHDELVLMAGRIRPAQAAVMARDLLSAMAQWRPHLIVREGSEYGGCIAAERLDIPYAAVEILASGLGDERRRLLGAGLASVLAEQGLPADPDLRMLERHFVLSPFPASYRESDAGAGATPRHAIRPTPFDQSGPERLPDWAGELPPRPTVFLTLGTVPQFNTRQSIFRAFIDGLANEPLNLLVAVGRNNDPADFGTLPPNVWIEQYIPQTLLFPRCDLVVCHAGSGTVMAALVHGLPLVLVPIAADQPQNARRCSALGLARIVDEETLDPAVARLAVADALENPAYRRSAERLRAEIDGLPGPEHAVKLLERLAAGHPRNVSG